MSNQWQEIEQFIKQADHVLIASHVNPDGDALGSTLAVAHACKQLGVSVTCVNESPIPSRFSFLPEIEIIQNPAQIDQQFCNVITVDVADRARVGITVERLFAKQVSIVNIDHHITNDAYGMINLLDPEASSTAEILCRWIDHSTQITWNAALATCLYTGLLTDTGGFRYANTTATVLTQAANLIEQGAASSEIAYHALETITVEQMKLLQRALSTLQTTADGRIAWLHLTTQDLQETGASDGDVEGIVNFARNLAGVEVGLFFRQSSADEIKVSFRSNKYVDVAKVAKQWGGGGHPRAAGCTIRGALSVIENDVVNRIVEELERV